VKNAIIGFCTTGFGATGAAAAGGGGTPTFFRQPAAKNERVSASASTLARLVFILKFASSVLLQCGSVLKLLKIERRII
jgi:hypothetical protein